MYQVFVHFSNGNSVEASSKEIPVIKNGFLNYENSDGVFWSRSTSTINAYNAEKITEEEK